MIVTFATLCLVLLHGHSQGVTHSLAPGATTTTKSRGVTHSLAPSELSSVSTPVGSSRLACRLGRTARVYNSAHRCNLLVAEAETPAEFLRSAFQGIIGIGYPPQNFMVIYDTGSANMWVPSVHCSTGEPCFMHKRAYNSSLSSSYKAIGEPFAIRYGTGVLKGLLSSDTVRLGENLVVPNQIFAEATADTEGVFSLTDFDGIVGMGFASISVQNVPPLLYNMKDKGVIANRVFSMFVTEEKGRKTGKVIFEGSDKRFFDGPMTYVKGLSRGYFNVSMDEVSVNHKSFCLGNCFAIVDTGSSLIGGPKSIINEINAMLGGTESSYGEYVLDCDRLHLMPDVDFKFGGRTFRLKAPNYVVKQSNGDGTFVCLSGFMSIDLPVRNAFSWVIGESFLTQYYVEYDLELNRVGFARKKN